MFLLPLDSGEVHGSLGGGHTVELADIGSWTSICTRSKMCLRVMSKPICQSQIYCALILFSLHTQTLNTGILWTLSTTFLTDIKSRKRDSNSNRSWGGSQKTGEKKRKKGEKQSVLFWDNSFYSRREPLRSVFLHPSFASLRWWPPFRVSSRK